MTPLAPIIYFVSSGDIDEVGEHTRPANLSRWDSMRHLMLVSGFEEGLVSMSTVAGADIHNLVVV